MPMMKFFFNKKKKKINKNKLLFSKKDEIEALEIAYEEELKLVKKNLNFKKIKNYLIIDVFIGN